METPGNGVGVVDDEGNAMYSDGCEEGSPSLPRGDLRSQGIAVGLHELRDLVVGFHCSADEVPGCVCSQDSVGEHEAGKNTHEAYDRHVVGEGVDGDVCGGQHVGIDDGLC
jgi:hypothetical protein